MANSFEFVQQRPAIQNALDQAHGLGLDNIAFDTFVDVGDRATIWRTLFSDGILTFESDYMCPFKHIVASIEPQQDLHGYDSPWPAGGGKNLININREPVVFAKNPGDVIPFEPGDLIKCISRDGYARDNVTYTVVDGKTFTVMTTSPGYGVGFVFAVTPGEIYTWSATYTDGAVDISYYDSNKTISSYAHITMSATSGQLTIPSNVAYAILILRGKDPNVAGTFTYVQLEKGSTATAYAPYSNECPISGWTGCEISHSGADTSDPEVLAITWQDSAGAVYGGNLAIDEDGSCKLTVGSGKVTLDGDTSWTMGTTSTFRYFNASMSPLDTNAWETNIISNLFKKQVSGMPYCQINGAKEVRLVFAPDDTNYDTVAKVQALLTETPLDVVYPLATPITYTLPEVTMLSSLLGTNNIWTNIDGGIAVTFKDENPLFITDPLNVGIMTLK